MLRSKTRCLFAFIGNLFEHYDTALFSLLIPFFASKIFPAESNIESLIKGFGLLPLTILTKPLGSIFFSWLSKNQSPELSLKTSYIGMAFVTFLIGLIPLDGSFTYAGSFLAIIRLIQGFFSSGETINGAMYVLENSKEEKKGFFSGLFDASSLAGFFIASLSISIFETFQILQSHWKYLFWFGSLAFIPSFALKKPRQFVQLRQEKTKLKIKNHITPFMQALVCCGISYAFFSLCFTFSNNSLCLMNQISKQTLQHQTSILFAVDMLVLPLFGMLSKKYLVEDLMKFALIISAFVLPLSFFILEHLDSNGIMLIRTLWTLLGALFSANIYLFYAKLFPNTQDVFLLSIATSLGSCLIGQSFSSLATIIFAKTNSAIFIGVFFSILSWIATYFLPKKSEKKSYLI